MIQDFNIIILKDGIENDKIVNVYSYDYFEVSFDELSDKINELRCEWADKNVDKYLTTYLEDNMPKEWDFKEIEHDVMFI